MMKFASFETIVEAIYNYLPGQKSDYNKGAQTGVAFTGGYLAGILCAIVSHPADVMVSKLNVNRLPGEAFGTAMGRIYKDIGFTGLWNGLPVRIVMIGTLVSQLGVIFSAELKLIGGFFVLTDRSPVDDVCTDSPTYPSCFLFFFFGEQGADKTSPWTATMRSRSSWVFQRPEDRPRRRRSTRAVMGAMYRWL